MITRHDLDEAIMECEGKRNPDASTCLRLAAFYTIRDKMYGNVNPMYSYAPPPESTAIPADSEFLRAVKDKPTDEIMRIMDELMESMRVLHPRIYDSVLRKVLSL